ncbi:acyltransferase family protein [Cryobacterium aureum]|uniref:acyltransferase family protein n=1 Tax=Cryobacterium aureum TaxID=995037 RepID=UPI001374D412|nr:acyltransferase [Cryobacterium aureum]
MRLLSALAVIVGHSFTLTGIVAAPRVAGIPIHSLGLYAFFAISGYLIATSWQRNPMLLPYLVNRSLRIFPALMVVVLVTVVLIGPSVTVLETAQYFRSDVVYQYLLNLVLTAQYELPGVFESGHRSSAVNGVLWTLGLEFVCYLVVAASGLLLRSHSCWGYLVFGIIAVVLALMPGEAPGLVWMGPAGTTWVFFAVGALLSRVATRWLRPRGLIIVVPLWIITAMLAPGLALVLAWLALPFVMIAAGRASTPGVCRAGRFGDLSYGMYLWGFLVQQLVIEQFGVLPWLVNIAIVVLVTAIIAALSWHLVEKRALAHKIHRAATLQPGTPRPLASPHVS